MRDWYRAGGIFHRVHLLVQRLCVATERRFARFALVGTVRRELPRASTRVNAGVTAVVFR